MGHRIESHGDIETMVQADGMTISIGDRVGLVFRAIDDPAPPIGVAVVSPSGQKIVDLVLRELPTGLPQSAPAVVFIPAVKGMYAIEVKELRGKQRGTASLRVG